MKNVANPSTPSAGRVWTVGLSGNLRPLRSLELIPDNIVGRPTLGDDFGHAVAIDVAAPQVLHGNLAVEHPAGPGLPGAVVIIQRGAVVLAVMTGDDFILAGE